VRSLLLASVIPLVLPLACGGVEATIDDCAPAGGIEPLCGFQNPEDLAPLPGGDWIAVSQMRRKGSPGSLAGLRASDGARRALYPPPARALAPAPGASRAVEGDPSCPGPPDPERFAPHGIDVGVSESGASALAAVNHAREAIEVFLVGSAEGEPALAWRGCVPLPEGTWANDVSFRPGGGLAATNMLPSRQGIAGLWAGLRVAVGATTGDVRLWDLRSGWRRLEGSAASAPNGITFSRDGGDVFVSEWGTRRLLRLRPGGQPARVAIELPMRPDNLSWARDGRLLVTGQDARLGDTLGCARIRSGTCALPFAVVAVETASLETQTLLAGDGTQAIGAASIALERGDALYIGTFAGDRVARARLPSTGP
jgi:hypothetical protein